MFRKPARNIPAAIATTIASAIWPVTRTSRPNVRRVPDAPSPPAFSALTKSVRADCQAGARPKKIQLPSAASMLNSTTRQSSCTPSTLGGSLGTLSVSSNRMPP